MTIETRYQKMDQHEHILELPDTYIGTTEIDKNRMWIYDDEKKRMINKEITYNPGMYKIFDEIVVNARDHTIRDKTCKNINIDINKETGYISVKNDGENGVPVAMHEKEKIYVPEMIFGVLLTSGNYKQKGKIVGGKNGYGAKLANIYSTEFDVQVVDKKRKKKYKQKFYENMYKKDKPIIKKIKDKCKSSLKISFKPDYKRFGMENITEDMYKLFKKRAYDVDACTKKDVNVYFNGELLNTKGFENYIKMFYELETDEQKQDFEKTTLYEKVNNRWEIGIIFDPNAGFQQITYVNGICTFDGGSHVQHVLDQIVPKMVTYIKSKHKDINLRNSYIRDNITIFLNTTIEDPCFTSQVKEKLKNKVSSFGSRFEIDENFIKKLAKTGLEYEVVEFTKRKDDLQVMKKTDGKKTSSIKGITKLDDANWAGTKKSKYCTLILTEGDSAKNFAVAGTEKIGKNKYGVFPLKGKLLNVREKAPNKLAKNEEIQKIKQIMGLQHKKEYEDVSKLRYGKILILTDQDVDGSHIKGLIINFVHYFWPSLMKIDGFIQSMATPIIKVWKKNKIKEKKNFYTLTEYENWLKTVDANKWKVKYYKGLGTHTSLEAKECFSDFEQKVIDYIWEQDKSNDAITLAFEQKRSNDRKRWLENYNRNYIIENDQKKISISDFIHKDFIHFSNYDCQRSIPSMCDGYKPSQRKILYGAFLRKIYKDEVKVSQLAGFVSDRAAYHHGEASLNGAIVKLAQDFPGSNNINILTPNGDFGSRTNGTSASPRYIFTQLNELTPLIYRKEDDYIYKYVKDDGYQVEPYTYAPIIPMILINGINGIGTGFSTDIPSFNPKDVINNIRNKINDKKMKKLKPWYYGFNGTIVEKDEKTYEIYGSYEIINENTIKVTEIPINVSIDKYKEELEKITSDDKTTKILSGYKNNSGLNYVNIFVYFEDKQLQKYRKKNELYKVLKLKTTVKLSNMMLYNSKGVINKYDTIYDIFEDYYNYRLEMYDKRKKYYIKILKNQLEILKWKLKFTNMFLNKKIKLIVDGKVIKKQELFNKLEELDFPKLSTNAFSEDKDKSYDYLDFKIFSLTKEEYDKLNKEKDDKEKEYEEYLNTTIKQIWIKELDELEKKYNTWLKKRDELNSNTDIKSKNKKSKTKTKSKSKNKK